MALVSNGWWLTVSLTDASGSVSTLEYQLRGADEVAAKANATEIQTKLADMTDSVISAYNVGERFYEDALVLPVGAKNTQKAVMTVQLAGSNKKAVIRIPSPSADVFVSTTGEGENQVALTRTENRDYVGLFTAGSQAFISDGETVAALPESLISGRRTSVKSSRP